LEISLVIARRLGYYDKGSFGRINLALCPSSSNHLFWIAEGIKRVSKTWLFAKHAEGFRSLFQKWYDRSTKLL